MESGEYRSIHGFIDGDHIASGSFIIVEAGSAAVVGDRCAEIKWAVIFWHGGIGFFAVVGSFGLTPSTLC